MKIETQDLAAVGICPKGARTFCRRHGLDFRKFIKEGGAPEEILLATGDAMARKLVEKAHGRRQR